MRKGWVLVLTAVCCLSLCGCAHWWELFPKNEATSEPAPTAALPSAAITVEGGSAESGDTVILPVTVNADAHLVDADVFLHYDATRLEPVLQYDAATDSERYAEPGIFTGTVRSEKLEDGTVYVMLATADDGTTAKGTLFYVAFRLLSEQADGATVTPEVPVCHLRANGQDVDAVAEGLLTLKEGVLEVKIPTVTATATATKTAVSANAG